MARSSSPTFRALSERRLTTRQVKGSIFCEGRFGVRVLGVGHGQLLPIHAVIKLGKQNGESFS